MSKYWKFLVFLLTFTGSLLISKQSFAIGMAKVLEISSTGMSLILDRGSFEGLRPGMKGQFLKAIGDMNRPKFKYLANAEVIKVHSSYSYWYMRDVNKSEFIDKGQRIVFVTMKEVLSGRRDAKFLKRRVILRKGDTPLKYVEEKNAGVPTELIKKSEKYDQNNQELTETYATVDEERIITEFETWSKDKNLTYVDDYLQEVETNRETDISEDRDLNEFREKDGDKLFKSVVDGSVKKFNDYKYSLNTFYKDQKKDEDFRQIRETVMDETVYAKYQKEKEERKWVSPQAMAKVERDGKLWSSDMDDEQLRRFFIKSGIRRENERQRLSLSEYNANEVTVTYSTALVNHYTTNDDNFQGSNYSLGVGYEYHLRRSSPDWDKTTIDAFLLRTISFYNMGGDKNGRFTEGIVKLGVNYYFVNNPATIYKWSFFGGMGIMRGNALGQGIGLVKDYNYQLIGVPTYLGFKYRFKSGDELDQISGIGWGLKIKFSYEYLKLNTVDLLEDDINGSISVEDVKFTVGLSTYF
ncbi:MAG: hypothetical protein KC493_04875 [Bacteriovoracaceae bacterium]|nr:hypothetical protein [Bacteriovoracaceae bacterium]